MQKSDFAGEEGDVVGSVGAAMEDDSFERLIVMSMCRWRVTVGE